MEAKRFTAGDMRRALQMVREHLGPDAVILSSKKNIDSVEVVATTDYHVEDLEAEQVQEIAPVAHKIYRQLSGVVESAEPEKFNKRQDQVTLNHKSVVNKVSDNQLSENKVAPPKVVEAVVEKFVEKTVDTADSTADDFLDIGEEKTSQGSQSVIVNRDINQDLTQMRYEIEGLRRMLSMQPAHPLAAPVASNPFVSKQQGELRQRLDWMGIPSAQHDYFLNKIDATQAVKPAWRSVLQQMQSQIKIAPRDVVDAGGIFALVGSTGAGKTTTIAKLATRYAMQYGAEQVGLISLDVNRVGGTQQLKTMGKLLGIPVRTVETAMDLEVSLRAFRGRSLVMIDTAGVRPGSEELTRLLKTLQVEKRIQCFLTLPATSQYSVMKTLLHCYQGISKGLIITKLDEAVSLGEVIASVIDSQLPVTYTTDGQLIPESIRLPNVPELMSLAVEKIRLRRADDEINSSVNSTSVHGTTVNSTRKQKINSGVSDLYSK